jgi:hypothetical protein
MDTALNGLVSSPVLRLPNELLASIYVLCGPKSGWMKTYGAADVLSFSQVCRRWRTVAVSLPDLWTEPLIRNEYLACQWIQRARGRPLELVWARKGPPYRPSPETEKAQLQALEYALTHGSRFTKMVVEGASRMLTPIIQAHAGRVMTEHLEKLDIHLSMDGDGEALRWSLPFSDDEIAQLPSLKLQSLGLGNCYPPTSSLLYAKLTFLSISTDISEQMQFDELLQVLKHTPLLEKCYLRTDIESSSVPLGFRVAANDPRVFSLDHLVTFNFSDSFSTFSTLLLFMVAPILSDLQVQDMNASASGALLDFPTTVEDIYTFGASFGWGKTRAVAIDISTDVGCHQISLKVEMEEDAEFDLKLESKGTPDKLPAAWFFNVTQVIQLDNITMFTFAVSSADWYMPGGEETWPRILDEMPRLDRLEGHRNGALHLLEALCLAKAIDTLPALNTLALVHTDLVCARTLIGTDALVVPNTLHWLLQFTTTRILTNTSLKRLELDMCGLGLVPVRTTADLSTLTLGGLTLPPTLETLVTDPGPHWEGTPIWQC